MKDESRTKSGLIRELRTLRRRNKSLEAAQRKRKQAEDVLRESEAKYRSLFENCLDAILLTTPDGKIFSANPAACEMFGRSEEEICRIGRGDIVDLNDQRIPEFIEEQSRIGQTKCEFYFSKKDGTRFPAEVTSAIFETAEGKRTSLIIRDITGRLSAEQASKRAEESHAILAQAIRSIGECVSITDSENKILFVNDAFLRTYGYAADELIGKPIAVVRSTTIEPAADKILSATLQGGWQGELVNRKKDGTEFPISLSTSIVRNEKGEPLGLVGIAIDITERLSAEQAGKRVEEQLHKSHEELRMLADHLQTSREEDRKRLARDFHDQLGQSMTALKMDLSLLLRTVSEKKQDIKPEFVIEELQFMQKLVDETIKLIWAIITDLRPQMLDDLGFVTTFEWEAKQFQSRTGISCEFESSLGVIQLDSKMSITLFRIYQEALSNIERHAKATVVKSVLQKDNEGLVLEIKDNGCGISIDKKSKPESFGLIGMRERAMVLGGSFEINGVPGEGTTIIVKLPVEQIAIPESTDE